MAMMEGMKGNKIAAALGEGDDDEKASDSGPATDHLAAMKAFEKATTTAEKVKAMKAFVQLCTDEYGEDS
jgi:hypothetical protein